MKTTNRVMWATVAAIAVMNLAVYLSHAAKMPNQAGAAAPQGNSLKPPANGQINVAFLISEGFDVMDIAGPWEAFSDTMYTSKGKVWHREDGNDMIMPFNLYTVSDSLKPVSSGLIVVPNYTFETAPKPQVIVVPAQGGRSEAQKAWLLANAKTADVTMSVCTGASLLAKYGLLDGQPPPTTCTRSRCRRTILQFTSSAERDLSRTGRSRRPVASPPALTWRCISWSGTTVAKWRRQRLTIWSTRASSGRVPNMTR